ncbi:AAA family ATPase [Ensifer adhaerens]|uniref:AAA family ATPase n=1 Tax=Ensifer adhaerens TaxID=106592 RepID=UPI000CF024F1|nr:AAA family ATPase [Ensifer adhaerens]
MEQPSKPATVNYVDDAVAVDHMRRARRILVVGCSGGGKSTLSQKLAVDLHLDYISIDRDIRWLPGWAERERAEQRQRIVERVAADRWIMDGNGPSTFDIRVPRSDIVIWVRMPRLLCVWGVVTRWLKHFGRTRPEMAPGCIEKVDWDFLQFIWTFEKKFSPLIVAGLAKHGPDVPVLQLKSRRQVNRLLDLLGLPA